MNLKMRIRKMKRGLSNFISKMKLFFSLPSVWVTILLVILALFSIVLSRKYYNENMDFESSLFLNIFIGLVTGFALSIISGTKAVYNQYLQKRYEWINETHEAILEFKGMHRQLYLSKDVTDDDYFVMVYDTGACASNINARIMQGGFNKAKWINPSKYFKKHYNYDSYKTNKEITELRETIREMDFKQSPRKERINALKPILDKMMRLNHDIVDDMESIKTKISISDKSII